MKNCNEVLFTTNKEVEIKVYIYKRKYYLSIEELAILYDKSLEVMKELVLKVVGDKKRHITLYKDMVLYDMKVIEKIGNILESKNAKLLKVSVRDTSKKYKDVDYEKLYIIDTIINVINSIIN